MEGNTMLAEIAAGARLLGWEKPVGIEHTDYVRRATAQMIALHAALRAAGAPRWWVHAYDQAIQDQAAPGWSLEQFTATDDCLLLLARAAPGRWACEVSLLAAGRRRSGKAQKLVGTCSRLQQAMIRHGVEPVGSAREGATTLIRADGLPRGLFLLAREPERERTEGWTPFWDVLSPGVGGSRARATREAWNFDDEGWSDDE